MGGRSCSRSRFRLECLPKLYGLPKIHKEGAPLRSIISYCGSITYNASKYLAGVLSPIVAHTSHHVNNSEEFIQKIGSQSLAPEEKLVSFDMCSLFTSIPVTEAVEDVKKKLEEDKHKSGLAPEQVLDLLQLCLSYT